MTALACVLLLAVPAQPAPAPAPTVATEKARLDAIAAEIEARVTALKDLDNQERSLTNSLGELDESLARLADEAERAKARHDALAAELGALAQDTGLDERALADAHRRLEARLRVLYLTGEGGAVRALLGAEGFEELALRRRFLRELAESDAKLVAEVARIEGSLADKRARLRAAAVDAEQVRRQIDEQRSLIAATREERGAALARIASERKLTQRQQRELEQRRAAVASLIGRLAEESVRRAIVPARPRGRLGRNLPWPAEGMVIRRYGIVVEKDSKAEVVSNGIEIRADQGAPVQAVADGRVAFVGWLRGFGRLVIVDHGGGVHSLSGHLAKAAVAVGDEVRRGQTIAFVGDTESTNGPKLYFELRENGRPRDPTPLLRAAP
ncbi:MAG: hypothetical protein A2138_23480 [Deltaproteobacteria bacterium RBG_16_71_12]|nr:MAG: hypothetical protein A2138_23480 [Deltaproteobacteria bacterium RBG_16_71_12]